MASFKRQLLRPIRAASRRLNDSDTRRFALDRVYLVGDYLISVGWHESPDVELHHGKRNETVPSTTLRFRRDDLDVMLGPGNQAGFVSIAESPLGAGQADPVRTAMVCGAWRSPVDVRIPDPTEYSWLLDVARRTAVSGSMDLLTAVRRLVLPAMRERIAEQATDVRIPAVRYRDPGFPSKCALNVVVPFHGTFDRARNIMSTLSLLGASEIGGNFAVTFVCDDPLITEEFVEFVQAQNSYVNRLPVALIAHATRRGLSTACNTGASSTESTFTLFHSADVVATGPQTILHLIRRMYQDPSIVAASPTLVFADGVLQARGLAIIEDPEFPGFGLLRAPCRGTMPLDRLPEVEDTELLPGALLAVRTATFDQVGRFTNTFLSGDLAAAELSTRLSAHGRVVVIDAPAVLLEQHSNSLDVFATLEMLATSEIYREAVAR